MHDVVEVGSGFQVLKKGGNGIHVFLNTQAPLTFPGILSTAGHCDQSMGRDLTGGSVAIFRNQSATVIP